MTFKDNANHYHIAFIGMSKFLGLHARQFMPSQLVLRALNGSEEILLCLKILVQVRLTTWSVSSQS